MALPPKKKNLDLMIAVGGGPKSRNPDGVTSNSIAAPDQGGGLLAEDGEMMGDVPMMKEGMEGGDENCILLPPGFKAPDGSEDGQPFTTTVRGKIMDGKFYPESIGDMPLKGSQLPVPSSEEGEEQADPMADAGEDMNSPALGGADDYAKKKADSMAAKKVFQS